MRRWRHVVFVLTASMTAVLTTLAAVPAIAAPRVPGIDVSKYQGRIQWPAVASSSVRFVIMRATLGNRYRDERYAQNLAGATANGLVVGAYHFAKPSLGLRDARGEADHFLRVARVGAGDVLPVLDIEETGGLSPEQLRIWAQAWLNRVHSRTGVRAMIYTGNYFWRGFMRNTSWFGHRGHPLWVAHWYVGAPDIPGDRWANNGYTVWQWSATGNIPGIKGPVDRDWVNGNLTRGTIASLTVAPAQGGTIRGDRVACGGPRDRCFRLTNPGDEITLSATPHEGARLTRWTGACAPAGDARTCTVSALGDTAVSAVFDTSVEVPAVASVGASGTFLPSRVGCATVCSAPTLAEPPVSALPAPAPPVPTPSVSSLRARSASASPVPTTPVVNGPVSTPVGKPSTCTGTDPDCAVAGLLAPPHVGSARSQARQEDEPNGTRYSWGLGRQRGAIGGSFRWERRASASISYRFRGGAVTLFTVKGPRMGKARVEIDGSWVARIDGYSRRFRPDIRHRFSDLGGGGHTLTITPLGKKRPMAKGRRVVVDALRWGGKLHRDPGPEAVAWASVSDPAASEGNYVVSDAPGAEATLSFSGTGLSLRAVFGPARGRAQIWLDGARLRTVDLYAPTRRFVSIRVASGLTHGRHVARVVVLGTRHRASQGIAVAIDRWVVAQGSEDHRGRPEARPGRPRREKKHA
ncbi:MAG TPA: GH25 family lysozyme [Actinomycetota bacterium]|nr:GH25 family lysozyme [Actinomycetota bacterium]